MVDLIAFEEMADEIVSTLPEEFFRDLNGGVMVKEYAKLHRASVGDTLYILGEYHRHPHLGRFVVLYYGSFTKTCSQLSDEAFQKKVRHVILHEFRHHLEGLAGERDLEYEDAAEIAAYLETYKN